MRWLWIDRIVELAPRQRLVAIKNVSLAEEHLQDHFPARPAAGGRPARPAMPIMPASLIIEGMAQAAGILVGHAEEFREKVILAKISRAEIARDATPGTTLRYTAEIERMDAAGASTRGAIDLLDHARPDAGWVRIGATEMMFSHLDNSQGAAGRPGEGFPAHNFVFGESFKMLLRTSGVAVPGE